MKTDFSKEIKIFVSRENDPRLNLALEEFLFWQTPVEQTRFFFYINGRSVISGKHQNPWRECDLKELDSQDIPFCRRFTGGGTVYHDPGNLNFSIINPLDNHSPEENLDLIISGLKKLGINADKNDKNDLLIGKRKFSGSAFAIKKQQAIHHGTLLIDTDLATMQAVLRPSLSRISGGGTLSRPADVINLSSIDVNITAINVQTAIIGHLHERFADASETRIDAGSIAEPEFKEIVEKYHSWSWNFGQTPKFDVTIDLHNESNNNNPVISVDKGIIKKADNLPVEMNEIYAGNRFSVDLLDEIKSRMEPVVIDY